MSAILRFPNFKFKAFSMSYDDGAPADKRLVEIMSKNGIVGTFNLCTDRFKTGAFPTKEDIKTVWKERHCQTLLITVIR